MKKITERTQKTLDGNAACAEALRQINPDVFGFYPITPTSYIGEKFSKFVADGEVETEYVCAESEHAAMSVCVGASAAGSRACTATASQGLTLMSEVLYNASGLRLPIVMINGNRSLGAPLSIHCDHGDAMAVRDAGWIQIFAENAQEAYDFLLMAPLIAEDAKVRTPIMVCMDCFQTTHTMMNVDLQTDAEVQNFVGEPVLLDPLLDVENPASYGNFDKPNFYMEHRRAQLEGLLNAKEKIPEIFKNFAKKFGRGNATMVDCYQAGDADFIIVVMASTAGTIRRTVDHLREKGIKVGMARVKVFRPFPTEEIKVAIGSTKNVLVLDRMSPAGANFGALGSEVASLFSGDVAAPTIKNAIYGLGSRETTYLDFAQTLENFSDLPSDQATWINLRED
jgi:pyruvate ferredoxin oxidoreductase alpha subunit